MHVALRCHEIAVTRELLNGASRSPTHRQMRTERMPEHMNADITKTGSSSRALNEPLDLALGE